eukprot:3180117-Amphidinium_carterae.1
MEPRCKARLNLQTQTFPSGAHNRMEEGSEEKTRNETAGSQDTRNITSQRRPSDVVVHNLRTLANLKCELTCLAGHDKTTLRTLGQLRSSPDQTAALQVNASTVFCKAYQPQPSSLFFCRFLKLCIAIHLAHHSQCSHHQLHASPSSL